MNELATRDFQHILLIKPSSPGDIIHALPVLHGLRRRYPHARIAWLIATPFADLVSADPALDDVVPFDRQRYGRLARNVVITAEFVRFVRSLRKNRFDLVIDLQGLFRSGFLAWAGGASVRIGFAEARELAPMFYTHRLPRPDADMHAADRNYRVARWLGFDDAPMDFRIHLTHDDRTAATMLCREAGVEADSTYVVLVPGTRWETKLWPADRFGRVAATIFDACGMRSLLVGGRSDLSLGRRAADASRGAAHNLCGRTSLRELAALIESAAVVVTGDSTPMHMAAAFDRPLVALFGPTNPARTGPYGRCGDVVQLGVSCAPCYYRRLRDCPYDHACMRHLDEEVIVRAALARLETPLRAAGR